MTGRGIIGPLEVTADLRDQSYGLAKLCWGFTVFFTA